MILYLVGLNLGLVLRQILLEPHRHLPYNLLLPILKRENSGGEMLRIHQKDLGDLL